MIYAVRKLVEADLTVAAINAQIASLNTLYTLTVPTVAVVADGAVVEPSQLSAVPGILLYVGLQPAVGETVRFGKRDFQAVGFSAAYHTKQTNLALARRDIEVTLEALFPLLEGLQGKSFGGTNRGIVTAEEFRQSVGVYDMGGAVVRVGGVLECTLWARTQGV